MSKSLRKILTLSAVSLSLLGFVFVLHAQAGLDVGLEYATRTGLGTTDIRDTIASIINVALGLLGIVAVVIVLYGGFVYMTSGGEAGKIEKARKTMISGAIGLAIILSAFAITQFIFRTLGVGGGGPVSVIDRTVSDYTPGGGSQDPRQECPDPNPDNVFSPFICSIDKQSSTAGSVMTISGGKFGDPGFTSFADGKVYFATADFLDVNASSGVFNGDEASINSKLESCDSTNDNGCFVAEIMSCGDAATWSNFEIVVQVPELDAYVTANNINDFYVIIQKSIGGAPTISKYNSSAKDTRDTGFGIDFNVSRNDLFTLASGNPEPGIICLVPKEGRQKTQLQVLGVNFGNVKIAGDNITFKNEKNNPTDDISTPNDATGKCSDPADSTIVIPFIDKTTCENDGNVWSLDPVVEDTISWANELIETPILSGSITGKVTVTHDNIESNGVRFDVTCGAPSLTSEDCSPVGCCVSGSSFGSSLNYCSAISYCQGGAGASCDTDAQCQSPLQCVDNTCQQPPLPGPGEWCSTSPVQCTTQKVDCQVGSECTNSCYCESVPTILEVFPKDGAPGTFVTIHGLNFGPSQIGGTTGRVIFSNGQEALPPAVCGDPSKLWSDTQIIVEVPAGAEDGAIAVYRADDDGTTLTRDVTSDDRGIKFDFDVNENLYPGLCEVQNVSTKDAKGLLGDEVLFDGIGFENPNKDTGIFFSGTILGNENVWSQNILDDKISGGTVPNLEPQKVDAQVKVGELFSNPYTFEVEEPESRPKIDYLDVIQGPKGQYVSIFGSNFGDNSGTLYFETSPRNFSSSNLGEALFEFPEQCSGADIWTDSNIIFKVPTDDDLNVSAIGDIDATISVANDLGVKNLVENDKKFTICNPADAGCNLTPGVCKIEPNQGPPGTPFVHIYGEGFGNYEKDKSGVLFFNTQPVDVSVLNAITDPTELLTYWSDEILGAPELVDDAFITVPQDASTGPVTIDAFRDGSVVKSSSINFLVADCRDDASVCETDNVCCAFNGQCMTTSEATVGCKPLRQDPSNLTYTFKTGQAKEKPGIPMVRESVSCSNQLQSPGPYKYSTDNCVNTQITASFVDKKGREVAMPYKMSGVSKILDEGHFNENTIQIFKCATIASDTYDPTDCDTTTDINPADGVPDNKIGVRNIQPVFETNDTDGSNSIVGFIASPDVDALDLNTWYLVRLISGPAEIRSEAGLWLDGDRDGTAESDDDYEWIFKTGNDPNFCSSSKVQVLPDRVELTAIDQTVDYSATTMAENCNVLDASGLDWRWSSNLQTGDDGSAIATISNYDSPDDSDTRVDPHQVGTAVSQGLTYIEAQPLDPNNSSKELAFSDFNNRLVVDLNIPEIYSITPQDGLVHPEVNSYVTISGKNFGDSKGVSKVLFGESVAPLAQCGGAWSDSQIKVRVPRPQEINDTNEVLIDDFDRGSAFGQARVAFDALVQYNFDSSSNALIADLLGGHDGIASNIDKRSGGVNRNAGFFDQEGIDFCKDAAGLDTGEDQAGCSATWSNEQGYVQSLLGESDAQQGSVEIWFKPSIVNGPDALWYLRSKDQTSQFLSASIKANGAIQVSGTGGTLSISTVPGIIKPQELYHLVFTSDDDGSRIYLNGKLMETTGTNTKTFFLDDLDGEIISYLGATATQDAGGFEDITGTYNGELDDFAIYLKPMSATQVMSNAGISPFERGAVGLYHFDGDGVIVPDMSGNGNALTSNDFPQRSNDGFFGGGLDFAGTNFVKSEGSKTLNFNQGVSLLAWINPDSISGKQTIISAGSYNSLTLSIGDNCGGNDVCFRVNLNNQGAVSTKYVGADGSTYGLASGKWNLLVGTYENDVISLYINGQLASEFDGGEVPFVKAKYAHKQIDTPVCIGAQLNREFDGTYNCSGAPFHGVLDTSAVYNRALSLREVSQMHGVLDTNVIKVVTSGGETSKDPIFTKSNNLYPFICAMTPNRGPDGITVALSGDNFGDSNQDVIGEQVYDTGSFVISNEAGTQKIFRRDEISSWSNNLITYLNPFGQSLFDIINFKVRINPLSDPFVEDTDPTASDGVFTDGETFYDLSAQQEDTDSANYNQHYYNLPDGTPGDSVLDSNRVPFYTPPVITSITPDNGPVDQWITIKGYNFGNTVGEVYFTTSTGFAKAELAECSDNWNPTRILVKVPTPDVLDGPAVTGPIFIRKVIGGSYVDSNLVTFTVNNNPIGAGICSIDPLIIESGEPVSIEGVRFGDIQNDSQVLINGENLGIVDASDWTNNNLSVQTDVDLTDSGDVVVTKRVKVGETCAGFQIGGFCPGGRVDDYAFVSSNSVPLDIVVNDACLIGLQKNLVRPSFNRNIKRSWTKRYGSSRWADTGRIATDGKFLYTLPYDGNSSDSMNTHFLPKIGSGFSDTERGFVNRGSSPSLYNKEYDSLERKFNKPTVGNFESYATQGMSLFVAPDGKLYSSNQNDTSKIIRLFQDRFFVVMAYESVDENFGSYDDPNATNGDQLLGANSRYVYNLSEKDGKWYIKAYDVFSTPKWQVVDRFELDDPHPSIPIRGILADDTYLYFLEWGGEGRMYVVDPIAKEIVSNYRTDQIPRYAGGPQTREVSGQIDLYNGVAWLGEFSAEVLDDNIYNEPSSLEGGLINEYACTPGGLECEVDTDCNACGAGTSSCVNSTCTPVITDITPDSSAIGSYVSVKGCYFGNSGNVYFSDSAGDIVIPAKTPDPAICGVTWSNDLVVVEVPDEDTVTVTDDAKNGPIELVRSDGMSTTSLPIEFNVDPLAVRPYVCGVTPNKGDPGDFVQIAGKGFGPIRGNTNSDFVTFKGDGRNVDDDVKVDRYVSCTGGNALEQPKNYWQFDKGSERIVNDGIGGADGTVHGALSVNGIQGSALAFDGVNDYVEITDKENFNFMRETGVFTIAQWVRFAQDPLSRNTGSEYYALMGNTVTNSENGFFLIFDNRFGYNRLNLNVMAGYSVLAVKTKANKLNVQSLFSDNEWHHIAFVVDYPTVKLYIDGQDVSNSIEAKWGALASTGKPTNRTTYIGSLHHSIGRGGVFNGDIDQVVIYDKAISADDVSALANIVTLQPDSSWSDTKVCALVPDDARSGAVEVTNEDIESNNKVPYTVYELTPGPQVSYSNPASHESSACVNSLVEIGFTKPLDESTIESNIKIFACDEDPLAPVSPPISFFGKALGFVKALFGKTTMAQIFDRSINCDTPVDYDVTTRTADGTIVSLAPKTSSSMFDPQTLYRVEIGEGVKGLDGVELNHSSSNNPLATANVRNKDSRIFVTLPNPAPNPQIDNGLSTFIVPAGAVIKGDILVAVGGDGVVDSGDERLLVTSVSAGIDSNSETILVRRGYYGIFSADIVDDDVLVISDDFTFSTLGTKGEFNSGICNFDDVSISVYNTDSGAGQIADKDFFVCTGENCLLPFDYDQAPGPLNRGPNIDNNQHRYIATAISEVDENNAKDAERFEDKFERTVLSQGDNSYYQRYECGNFALTNNQVVASSVGSCEDKLFVSEGEANPNTIREFLRQTPFTFEGELFTDDPGYGFTVGGNKIFTRPTASDPSLFEYVMVTSNGSAYTSLPVASLPSFSRWDVEFVNGTLTLKVDGKVVLPRKALTPVVFESNGEFGLYISSDFSSSGIAVWDNITLELKSFNVLKGIYTWSRSDATDPLRLVTIHPPTGQDDLPDNSDAVQNGIGEIYADVQPIAAGQTKIGVVASTDVGFQYSNQVSKEFPINVFICENPWPNFDPDQLGETFDDQKFNFLTFYCRDVGDAKNPTDNLPPATILERCDYVDSDAAANDASCDDILNPDNSIKFKRDCSSSGTCVITNP